MSLAWYNQDKLRGQQAQLKSRRNTKHKAFALFGGKCQKCGFDDERALQIDHIYADGATDLRGQPLYRALTQGVRNIIGLQLLCANCNAIKKIENNEHRFKQLWDKRK